MVCFSLREAGAIRCVRTARTATNGKRTRACPRARARCSSEDRETRLVARLWRPTWRSHELITRGSGQAAVERGRDHPPNAVASFLHDVGLSPCVPGYL